jgi:O-antigen/teichoic acid export membrane protein
VSVPAVNLVGANVARYLSQFVLLLLILRTQTPRAAGLFVLAMAIATPMFRLSELGLRSIYLTHKREYGIPPYLLLLTVSTSIAFVTISSVTVLFAWVPLGLMALVALNKLAETHLMFWEGPLQARGRTRSILRIYVVNSAATIGAAGVGLVVFDSVLLALSGSLLASVLCVVLMGRTGALSPHRERPIVAPAREIARAGFPMGVSVAMITLVSTVPQYGLAASVGPSAAARFAIAIYSVVAIELFLHPVAQAWLTKAVTQRSAGSRELFGLVMTTIRRWAIVLAICSIAIAMASYVVYPFLFGEPYALSVPEAVAIAVAIALLPFEFIGIYGLSVVNRYASNIYISLATVVVCLGTSAVLIPRFEVVGALWAFCSAIAARGLLACVLLLRDLKRQEGVTGNEGMKTS